jgi:mycofactocin precursor
LLQLGTDEPSARGAHAGQLGAAGAHAGQLGAAAPGTAGQDGGAGAAAVAVSGVEGAPVVEDVLVEDVSIDGMCGVY